VDFLTDAGADHVIISDEEDVAARLLDITAGQGVRVAYDPVSGAYVRRYVEGMRAHGLIILYGSLEKDRQLPRRQLYQKAINCYYYSMYNHVMDTAQLARGKALIYGGIATGQLRPIIDRVFPLDQFREAYRHLFSNTQTGKIVVRVE
jgi:NADPH:quinone reductase-like Zn-dependent oxidoreductase